MIRLTFHASLGEGVLQSRATFFRFCADATLRGPDNSLAATRVDDCWRIGQRLFREWNCIGPVLVRVRKTPAAVPISMGPYRLLRAAHGVLYGDEVCLSLRMPGWSDGVDACHEVALLDATST